MKRNSLLSLIWNVIYLIGGCIIVVAIILFSLSNNNDDDILAQALYYIRTLYVDEVDKRHLADVGIRAMLDELGDPNSSFLDAAEARRFTEPMRGNIGIGISFDIFADTLYVWGIIADSPAKRAGMMRGDRIIYINDTLVAGVRMNREEITSRLSSAKGTSKDLSVLRRGVSDLINFQVISYSIPAKSVVAAYMITDDIGYIRLNVFSETSADEFKKAVSELQEQGMTNLIFDLAYNRGGDINNAYDIANEFLERESIVFHLRWNSGGVRQIARHAGSMHTGNLVVLVNEESASGSEMFAGAMQDWDRGVIVGRRTFGKGTAQSFIPFDDGSMLRLTTGRIFTPIGRSVERFYDECETEAFNRNIRRHLLYQTVSVSEEYVHLLDSIKFTTLVNKRRLIGGGGIFPDYVVPQNTVARTHLFRNLNRNGIFRKAAISKVDNNRYDLLKKYPDAKAFRANYQLPSNITRKLRRMAENAQIEWNNRQFETSHSLIFTTIKAYMARDLYNSSAFFLIMNKKNDIFQEGLRIISDTERYKNLLRGIGGNVGVRRQKESCSTKQ
jgi:carboxyl-terminal processing protease